MKTAQELIQSYEKFGVVLSIDTKDTTKLRIEMAKSLTSSQYNELREYKKIILEFLLNQSNANNDVERDESSFDELGYVSEKYDHLSDQYQSQPGSFWSRYTKPVGITPQQALGIEEISSLERQISDFLKKYGVCGVKHVATKLRRNEEEIRNISQNSALIEYRKCSDGYETLFLEEVNYPARFVAFIESLESIDLDDLLQLLENIEAYLKQHGQHHLDDWVKFCTRFVIYHKDNDNPVASLRKALIYQL